MRRPRFGAIEQALKADPNLQLTALGDLFPDKLQPLLNRLKDDKTFANKIAGQVQLFSGFDAYKEVIANCDVVLLCTPPHFRPMHLKAAVDAEQAHLLREARRRRCPRRALGDRVLP